MDRNADSIAANIESKLMYYEELLGALADGAPINPSMLYVKRQSIDANLVLLRQSLYDSIDCAEMLLPSLGILIIEWRSAMSALESSYADCETTMFSQATLLADCQEYRERFLAYLQFYDHDSPVYESDIYLLSNTLSIRTWLDYLLDYLHRDDPQQLAREIHSLDAVLRTRMPRTIVEWLGSWDDHDYRCMELSPLTHWWRYREGYAAATTAGA
jgi:hypothetical protein